MPETQIDELIEAVETVRILKSTIGQHAQLLSRIVDKIEQIDRRLAALEAHHVARRA